ncbi:UDP-2,4-diacetamido-2,4,6-trideoxy-beta-L-altropyranose hydrolase [Bacillus mojavensis]|uniref:UDP-2,4-diacetamido-2,4, 6-trideoxy-beta-L-altropyranose hydrolase n=1 Tax=Bacillus mojavensis TaxID=72360 RepID=UPI002DBE9EF9|nr:UDP-2,4-diacetamido-2,4,6-trideoxy-beta-L-altropyranose hydrolase [Bacillus mojavensis]MEC1734957.1 UDP-2,4-diacetamido-2,4,6-trideoxy-beta-L-altropyranose hydrolase [Bacillus mojavensis]MED1007346.1 UDP-2,4-diacetamido-2,4,6-trideoxy-beta-L-altropyranose hydrolase [Bacillus mojavensis]
MNILFRTDASIEIGTGHVMRCLTLAHALRKKGANMIFICRDLQGHLAEVIREKQFDLIMLPEPKKNVFIPKTTPHSDWLGVPWYVDAAETISAMKDMNKDISLLIIDHYAIDINWEMNVKKHVKKMMVIDDLADRLHDCDILLDQNLYHHYKDRYVKLVPESCKQYLGPEYVLLRDEFYSFLPHHINRDGSVKKILVFFGGSDPTNETKKVIKAFQQLSPHDIELDIVIGNTNTHKNEIESICNIHDYCNFHCQVNHIAELMYNADLAIGAGGTTTWERCYLGLPAIVITVAENQESIAQTLDQLGAIKYLGPKESVKESDIVLAIQDMMNNPLSLQQMSRKARLLLEENIDHRQNLLLEILK